MSYPLCHDSPHEYRKPVRAGGPNSGRRRSSITPPVHHTKPPLPINDALQIKAAGYWLKLGQADQALRELEQLPEKTWMNSAAVKLRVTAIGMLRERGELEEALWA
jgi:hypothetical protein